MPSPELDSTSAPRVHLGTVGQGDTIRSYATAQQRRGLLGTTVSQRTSNLSTFQRWFGGDPLDATPADIEDFLDSRRGRGGGPATARTIYRWVSNLHGFYEWAQRQGLIHRDPTVLIDRPRLRRGLPRPIPDEDLELALAAASQMMAAWITLAAFAGLRCAEIAGMERDWIDRRSRRLRVMGKGRKERLVPLHPRVEMALTSYGLPTSGLVFRRPRGAGFPPAMVSREGSLFFESLGIDATMHMCRHWFGSTLYEQCGDIRVVQETMGHESINTTMIYTAFSNERADEAVRALALATDRTAVPR